MAGIYIVLFFMYFFSRPFQIHGSGSLYDPPNRSVMWKYGYHTKKNYDYMQLNCGGEKQPENGTFNCGICGDPGDGKKEHERGGKYGSATISRYYPAGTGEIPIKIELLNYVKGFFEFRICPVNDGYVTQECLDRNMLPIKEGYLSGDAMRFYPKAAGDHRLTIAVNPNMTCSRCVLQWRYHTANSWGTDPITKKEGLGYGPQIEFRNCADVRIGGEVPKSVKKNPFFGPKYRKVAGSAVDTPQKRRKSLRNQGLLTASLLVQPEHADHLSPDQHENVFDSANQITSDSVERSSWLTKAVSGAQHEAQGSVHEPIVGNRNLGGAATPADIVILKKLVQPADGQIKLTAGTDIVKLGKGEGKIRKIKSKTRSSGRKTMAATSTQSAGTFALSNMLSDGGGTHRSVNTGKFAFDSGSTMPGHRSSMMHGGMASQKIKTSTNPSNSRTMTGLRNSIVRTSTHDITMGGQGTSGNGANGDVKFTFGAGKATSGQQGDRSVTATGSSFLTSSSSSRFNLNQDNVVPTADTTTSAMHNIATSMTHEDMSSQKIKSRTNPSSRKVMTGIQRNAANIERMLNDGVTSGSGANFGGDTVKFTFDSGEATSGQQGNMVHREMSNTAHGMSFLTSSSSQFDQNQNNEVTTTDSYGLSREVHNIATGVMGNSSPDNGRNLELTLPGQDHRMGSSTSEQTFGLVGPAPNPKATDTITMNAATVGGSRVNKFGSMRAATRSAVSFLGDRSSNIPFNMNKGDSFNQGNNGFQQYDPAITGMDTQTVKRPGDKQRIFQIKVTKPLEMSEGIQPSIDVTSARNGTVKSKTVSTTGHSGKDTTASETFVVDPTAASTTMDSFSQSTLQSNLASNTPPFSSNPTDIKTLKNELIRGTFLQGSDLSSLFSIDSASATGNIHPPPQNIDGELSVQNTTNPTGFSDAFIENNIDAIMKEANALLSRTAGGTGSFSIDSISQSENQRSSELSVDNTFPDQTTQQTSFSNKNNNIVVQGPNTFTEPIVKQDTSLMRSSVSTSADSTAKDVSGSKELQMVPKTERQSVVMEAQHSRPFHESLMNEGSRNSAVADLAGATNDIISRVVGHKLGGLTIDLTQSDPNKAHGKDVAVGKETSNTVVQKSQSVDTSNQQSRGTVSISGGSTLEQGTRETQRLNQGIQSLFEGRRGGTQETQRTQSESVDIVRQLNAVDLNNIPAIDYLGENQMGPDNMLDIGRDSLPGPGRTDTVHRMDRIGDTTRDRMRGDFVDRRRGDRMSSRRRSFGTSGERQTGVGRDQRMGDMSTVDRQRGQGGGFRIVVDPRTGLEMRLPVGDSRTDMRFRETPRPFGRRAGDRLVSDMRGGDFRRIGTSEGDRRSSHTTRDDRRTIFGMRTRDRGRESRTGSSFFDQMDARRSLDRSGRTGSRDAPYFVDMSRGGSMAVVNDTDVVIDTGLAVGGSLADGQLQVAREQALMPRDPTEAFSRRTGSSGRRDTSADSGGGPSDIERTRSEGTRRVFEGDLSGGDGRGRPSDRGGRRESSIPRDVARRFVSGGRSSMRDGRRETGTRRDTRSDVDRGSRSGSGSGGSFGHSGGRAGGVFRRLPMTPVSFGGFPGGARLPGVSPFGVPIMPPSGMPSSMIGGGMGPFGGSLGGPFTPMGFGPGMV